MSEEEVFEAWSLEITRRFDEESKRDAPVNPLLLAMELVIELAGRTIETGHYPAGVMAIHEFLGDLVEAIQLVVDWEKEAGE